jgi:hypothetical protein
LEPYRGHSTLAPRTAPLFRAAVPHRCSASLFRIAAPHRRSELLFRIAVPLRQAVRDDQPARRLPMTWRRKKLFENLPLLPRFPVDFCAKLLSYAAS